MSMKELMAAGNSLSLGEPDPEGVSFDGTNDYLSRSSDLSGNTDSKTFTFSAWVYLGHTGSGSSNSQYGKLYFNNNGTYGLIIETTSLGEIRVRLPLVAGNDITFETPDTQYGFFFGWTHFLISFDIENMSYRSMYINDRLVSTIYGAGWTTTSSANIDFTASVHYVAYSPTTNPSGGGAADGRLHGRLAHTFLDYTYRDLSIEANRRLFITADGKPATGQSSVDKYLSEKFDANQEGASTRGIQFNSTGSKMYLLSYGNGTVFQYSLSIAYDITSASYDGVSKQLTEAIQPNSLTLNDDGTKFFVCDDSSNSVKEYTMSSAYDLSTAAYSTTFSVTSQTTNPTALEFNASGSKMFVADRTTGTVYVYDLSTDFLVSSASYNSVNKVLNVTNLYGMLFSPDGTTLVISRSDNDTIASYSLSVAYDVTTCTLGSSFFVGDLDSTPTSIEWNSDGSVIILAGYATASVYALNLSTPYDISTASYGEAEGTPQAPIIYLPMKDAATAGENLGSGGSQNNFSVNGILDTAGRGPNQFNCSASKFDGANDYLQISGNLGASDGKLITYSGILRADGTTGGNVGNTIRGFKSTGSANVITGHTISFGRISCAVQLTDETGVNFTYDYNNNTSLPYHGRYWHVSYSIDVSDNNKRTVIINGVNVTAEVTWTSYSNLLDIHFSSIVAYSYSANNITPTAWDEQTIGEVYLDNTYTDLSTDNPFWDADANRPKPVRQVISETGTTPLIALPLRGDDAGNNLGSGGDFTVYSGPFTGARGGSEFWARSVKGNGSSSYLNGSTGTSNSSVHTLAFAINRVGITQSKPIINTGGVNFTGSASGAYNLFLDNQNLKLHANNGSLNWETTDSSVVGDQWNIILLSYNGISYDLYINGVVPSVYTTSSGTPLFPFNNLDILYNGGTDVYADSSIGFLWADDSYIDFSQESNRNLFVDQLGYPKDLTPAIEAGTIADPLIYMKFDDTSSLGANSGTGVDFSVNGTVIAGADVGPNA